jgi:hypothetical protein
MKTKAPKPKPRTRQFPADDKAQYERFRQAARELETDDSEEGFERAFRKVVPSKRPTPSDHE